MLNKKHYEVMKLIKDGATVYGYSESMKIREIQKFDKELVEIIGIEALEKITGEKFNGVDRLPYFGAILTPKGKEYLKDFESQTKYIE